MQARSALFDLFGDHLRPRGGRAPIAALVRLLAPIGIAAPAVRTAVSRMVRQGWLVPVRLPGGPGYQLTVKAVHRLDEAAARIYRTNRPAWDGQFDLLVLSAAQRRTDRARLHATLAYLGYATLDETTWVSPRPTDEAVSVLTEAGVAFERFAASHADGLPGAAAMVRRAWNLGALAEAYDRFVADLTPVMTGNAVPPVRTPGSALADEAAYAARFQLVHAWRSFLFRDPQLPPALLPEPWAGATAAAFFDQHEARLRPAADRFVDRCLPKGS
ncbi:MAG TPA: PaaX family transcriptional regulator C-terminal domain-containing protein [Micromonosporaceae bacterium]